MKHRITKLASGFIFALSVAAPSSMAQHDGHGHSQGGRRHEQEAASSTTLPKCPITDELVNLAVSIETDDGPVFFCCEDCISKYQADPSKYAEKVTAQRRALADRPKIQVACPVSKEPVDPDIFIQRDGQKVYFCCKGCANKYRRDPDKYGVGLANSYTFQTKCPVMNEEINPESFTTTALGINIYFCCKACDKKFFQDPFKYAPNLVSQGYTVNPKEMTHDEGGKAGHDHDSNDHGGHDHDH